MPMTAPIYMNNAATSYPKPPCVAEAAAAALSSCPGAMNRGGVADFDVFDAVRKALAPVLGVSSSSHIALGCNATWGLNQAIFGMRLLPNDTVVTTKAEHNSVLRPLYALEQQGIRVVYLDTDRTGRTDPEQWAAAIEQYRPKLAVFTHASNVTGAVNDAERLTGTAKAAGATVLIDASQTVGCVEVNAEQWGADMVAFTGHKYLLGPQGTGGVWVRPGLTLQPHILGGTGIKSDMDTMPREMPLHLEAGTGNEPSYHGLLAALLWAKQNPVDQQALDGMVRRLSEGLKALGAQVIDPGQPRTPVVSFLLPGESASETGYLLEQGSDIICRTGLHCAPKLFSCLGAAETVRLSLSRFTTLQEVDAVLQAVEDIMG